MIHDDFDVYESPAVEVSTYVDEKLPADKVLNDKARREKRRRLDELLEERRLKSELDGYFNPLDQKGSYYEDDIFGEV